MEKRVTMGKGRRGKKRKRLEISDKTEGINGSKEKERSKSPHIKGSEKNKIQ
jgi:hypothetical protein